MTLRTSSAALLLVWGSSLSAQGTSDPLTAQLSHLRPGQHMRIALHEERWTGTFHRVAGDTLYFGLAGEDPMRIPLNVIDTVWRATNGAGRGARIGGITGMVLGGLMGLAFMGVAADGGSVRPEQSVAALGVGGIIVGSLGAVVGLVVGAPFRGWARIYPSASR